MVSTITILIIAVILGVVGVVIPEFIVPAIVVAALPLFIGIFNNNKDKNKNDIDKTKWQHQQQQQQHHDNTIDSSSSPKKGPFNFITKRLGFGKNKDKNNNAISNNDNSSVQRVITPPTVRPPVRSPQQQHNENDDESLSLWNTELDDDDNGILTNYDMLLLQQPAPWDTYSDSSLFASNSNNSIPIPMSWHGIGVDDQFAISTVMPNAQSIKLIKVGKMSSSSHFTEFVSHISDSPIEEEAIHGDDGDKNIKSNAKESTKPETIRSGDIIKIFFPKENKYLTVYQGMWMGYCNQHESKASKCYFKVVLLDEQGLCQFGTPILCGQPFKLRSARWPSYEIGYQYNGKSSVGQNTRLVLYEWINKRMSSAIRWRHGGGMINPLYISIIPQNIGNIPVTKRGGWFGDPTNCTASSSNFDARIVGWSEILHRSNKSMQLVFIVVSSFTGNDGKSHRVTLLRPAFDVEAILESIEAGDGPDVQTGVTPIFHETPIDKNCRVVAARLDRLMGKTKVASSFSPLRRKKATVCGTNQTKNLLAQYFCKQQVVDSWFMTNTVDLAVLPPINSHVFYCARAIWETHWAEEVVFLTPINLLFYPLQSKRNSPPVFSLAYKDILSVSTLPNNDSSPLPGYYIIAIETIGRVYYMAIRTNQNKGRIVNIIMNQINITNSNIGPSMKLRARLDVPESYVLPSGQYQPATRKILNARKFSFNLPPKKEEQYWKFSARLLKLAIEIDPSSYDNDSDTIPTTYKFTGGGLDLNTDKLSIFLNEIVYLKTIDISRINLQSPEALCFFVNIYHTLLIHSRILFKPPNKQNWPLYFASNSYEIGGDVFSLAELEQCVIRGVLSRPRLQSKHDPPLIVASDDHYNYALGASDQRVHFIINNGSVSHPNGIFLLTPENFKAQLNKATEICLDHSITVDMAWRSVMLPKVCEKYKDDFGTDNIETLQDLVTYLKPDSALGALLKRDVGKSLSIKYLKFTYESHTKLTLIM